MRILRSLLGSALILGLVGAAPALDVPRREILATGDAVPTLGRIGRFSARLRGLDDRGRLLVAGDLSDGSAQLFRADGSGLQPVLPSGPFVAQSAVTSPSGRVAVRAAGADDAAIYVVDPDGARAVVRSGDVFEGLDVSALSDPLAIADDGTVIVSATMRPLGAPASSPPQYVLLAAGPGGARLVAGDSALLDEARRFDGTGPVGVTADGVVVFNGMRGEAPPAVYAADAAGVRRLVGPGTRAPSGVPFRELTALSVNPAGELLLRGCLPSAAEYPRHQDCAIYRSENGRLLRIAGPNQRTDSGALFDATEGALNARGDALLRAGLLTRCNDGQEGLCDGGPVLLLLPAGGSTVATVHRGYDPGYLNANAAVALLDAPGLVRWEAGVAQPIVTPDTPAPNGAAFLSEGFDNGSRSALCFAADGRVGAFVVATRGGVSFVCADADGVHVVAREGDAPFESAGYFPDIQCAFADDDQMYLGSEEGIFRASTAAGLEPVIGRGDTLPDGDPIHAFWLGESYGSQIFSVNHHGAVAAVYTDDTVLLRRPGGAIEVADLRVDGGSAVSDVVEAAVGDDESILATVQYWDDPGWPTGPPTRVLRIGPEGARVIARRGPQGPRPTPAVLDGSPVNLHVAGTLASFSTDHGGGGRPLLYDPAGGVRELLAGPYLPAQAYVIDLAADGGALLDTDYYGDGRFYFDGTTLERLSESDLLADRELEPVALGAPGAVLFAERQHGRQSLSVSGPLATGRCPRITAVTPSPTPTATLRSSQHGGDGCAVGEPAPGASWLLPVVAIAAALRRLRRALLSRSRVSRG